MDMTQYCQDVSFSIDSNNAEPNPTNFSMDVKKLVLKFTQRCKRPRIANIMLKNKNIGRLTLLNFKTHCKATVTGSVLL